MNYQDNLFEKMARFLYMVPLLFFLSVTGAYSLEVKFLIGDVSLTQNGRRSTPDIGTKLNAGSIISTSKGALAVLDYGNGSEIKVYESSRVKIGSITTGDSDTVSVISGTINAKFSKLARKSTRKVVTPTTVCSVRGTDFLIGVSEGADSRVEMKKGKLELKNPYGKIDVSGKDKAEINVSQKPGQYSGDADMKNWKKIKNDDLAKHPETKGEKLKSYFGTLEKQSKDKKKEIRHMGKDIKKMDSGDKKDLEATGSRLNDLEGNIVDDMLLNEAANSSIDGILQKFKSDKEYIYDSFLKIKKESNRVLEQQRANYEAIQAVREAYKKAYKEIMGKHQEMVDSIKGNLNKDSVKPKIKKK